MVEPPREDDEASVVARYNGRPIKAGFRTEIIEDSETTIHTVYRSGKFDLELKIDFEIGRGQVKVQEADGYDVGQNNE